MKLFNLRRQPLVTEALTHRNLAVYFLHSPSAGAKSLFLTLDEALRAGCARLHETGKVGELEVENLVDADLYAQAGDVMKGGWQDRALGADCIVPQRTARRRRTRIRTFCVERGRWNDRDGEEPTETDGTGQLSIFAAFFDRQQVLAGAAGRTLRLTGYSTDAATGLNVCYEAAVEICAAAPSGAG